MGEEPGTGVQGRAGYVRGGWGREVGRPSPGVSGAEVLESGEGWVSNFLPSLSQAGRWTLGRGDKHVGGGPCLLMLVFSWGRDEKQANK